MDVSFGSQHKSIQQALQGIPLRRLIFILISIEFGGTVALHIAEEGDDPARHLFHRV